MTPLPAEIVEALAEASRRLERAGVPFVVSGGVARALLGCTRAPSDLDLEVDAQDAERAASALGLGLSWQEGGGRAGWRAVGRLGGAALDLTAGLHVGAESRLAPNWPAQLAGATSVEVAGRTVLAAPIEEQIARALVCSDWAGLAKVAQGCDAVPIRIDYVRSRLASATAAS